MSDTVQVPAEVISLLMEREGWRTKVYRDTAPNANPTCGMGHLLSASEFATYPEGATVPDGILHEWQSDDSEKAYIAGLSQARQIGCTDQRLINALACVSFQLGAFWYRPPKGLFGTWALLMKKEWAAAANHEELSLWAKETPTRARDFYDALMSLEPPTNNGVDHGNPPAI